jgi:predicted RNA-binding Zn-ribbon protein involved in translation (DUF1610 family)
MRYLADMTTSAQSQSFAPNTSRYCPTCGAVMSLARLTPGFWSLPELETFRCPRCGEVFTWEVERTPRPH